MSSKLLSLSADLVLLINRNQALATAGFRVASPRSISDAPRLLESQPFAAVLIGNSIPPAQRQLLIREMRDIKPAVPIIFVTVVSGEHEPAADLNFDVSQDIAPLIRALQDLSSRVTDATRA